MIISHRPPLGAALAALFTVAALNFARASVVVPGDTFSVEAVGYNTTAPSGDIYLIAPTLQPTFGATQTYADDALNEQSLTLTSSEYTVGGVTTDTIVASVPTNFVPTGVTDNNGNIINAIQFSIGIDLGGSNPLDFSTALSAPVSSGAVIFHLNGVATPGSVPQNPSLSNGNRSYSDFETVTSSSVTSPISGSDVTSFSITITSATVPEPSTVGAVLLGAGLLVVTLRRRASSAA